MLDDFAEGGPGIVALRHPHHGVVLEGIAQQGIEVFVLSRLQGMALGVQDPVALIAEKPGEPRLSGEQLEGFEMGAAISRRKKNFADKRIAGPRMQLWPQNDYGAIVRFDRKMTTAP